jgi:hypothetical protein
MACPPGNCWQPGKHQAPKSKTDAIQHREYLIAIKELALILVCLLAIELLRIAIDQHSKVTTPVTYLLLFDNKSRASKEAHYHKSTGRWQKKYDQATKEAHRS